jgi:hypothetical protein
MVEHGRSRGRSAREPLLTVELPGRLSSLKALLSWPSLTVLSLDNVAVGRARGHTTGWRRGSSSVAIEFDAVCLFLEPYVRLRRIRDGRLSSVGSDHRTLSTPDNSAHRLN